jgi:hypothetical protein
VIKGPKFFVVLVALLALATPLLAVDVHVDFDKAFDFKTIRTWGWNPEHKGDVKMARNERDDPEAMRKRLEPTVVESVTTEMGKRGLTAAAAAPDMTVTYYALLTLNTQTQTMGQFLPGTVAWGLPPFAQSTTSLKFMNAGALVLDLSAKGNVVWRGVAKANIKFDATDKERTELIQKAVRDLLKKYPPKPPKA